MADRKDFSVSQRIDVILHTINDRHCGKEKVGTVG